MTISANPTATEINIELGRAGTASFSIDGAEERALAEVPTGAITFADFIGKSAVTEAAVILAATMTSGLNAGAQRTGYYVGAQGFGPYGSLAPDALAGGYNSAQCVGITYVEAGGNDFEFWVDGDFTTDPQQFDSIYLDGITVPSFEMTVSYSELTIAVLTGGETYYRFDTAGQVIPNGATYKVLITGPGYLRSKHTLTVGQVNANTYGYTKG